MDSSLKEIDEMLEEYDQEMQLVQKKKARLVLFREKMLDWEAQEQMVTREWEESR